jgi:UDP-N-acetylmuramyl pentapeptide phosphotransferase/UDP-N-acetylglucosamine-1-phosphate transferase
MLIFSTLLLIVGCVLSISNWYNAYRQYRNYSTHSTIPLLGGAMICAGVWLSPYLGFNHLWWIGFVLDYGCAPLLLRVIVFQLSQSRSG